MKANLMHPDRDFDLACGLPANAAALTQDLDLDILCSTMAQGDQFIFDVSKRALLLALTGPEAITYRQHVLTDCLANPSTVRQIYVTAVEAVSTERKIWGLYSGAPHSILSRALQATRLLLGYLRQLRRISEEHADEFSSEGFSRFFGMVSNELSDEYFKTIEAHLSRLRFRDGTLISAGLDAGNTAKDFVLRRTRERRWRERVAMLGRSGYRFEISTRDEAGLRVLDGLNARGLNLVANAMAQSAEHIRSFFTMVAAELAFYVGCVNLHDCLSAQNEPTCLPDPRPTDELAFGADGLYDVCLALRTGATVVGNAVQADGKSLIIVTGANQGGKSTFLRSIGLAQLMMQCGMFVPSVNYRSSLCTGIFSHFKREEDPTMKSGKFDEELLRMSDIVSRITPGCLLLCNESFASTNEREGSEIAHQVVRAMTDAGVKVVFVTHLFELAHGLYGEALPTAEFLRAERLEDGTRTFQVVPGEPLPTSYGEDSYWRIFRPDQPEDRSALATR